MYCVFYRPNSSESTSFPSLHFLSLPLSSSPCFPVLSLPKRLNSRVGERMFLLLCYFSTLMCNQAIYIFVLDEYFTFCEHPNNVCVCEHLKGLCGQRGQRVLGDPAFPWPPHSAGRPVQPLQPGEGLPLSTQHPQDQTQLAGLATAKVSVCVCVCVCVANYLMGHHEDNQKY